VLSLTHVGTAVVFVLAGIAVISRSLAAAGRAPAFELVSALLITLIGLYLLYRTVKHPQAHEESGVRLAAATGFVPCPLTTFILTYAIAHNKLAIGLAAVIAMCGVIVTIVSFLTAVLARQRLVAVLAQSQAIREKLGFWLELLSAVAVLALGLWMLADCLASFSHMISTRSGSGLTLG
jgi:ABC-type nickel/cobalt efflux system permease component RcnA